MLIRLLECLAEQETGGAFTYSAMVVDNDESRSAETAVLSFAGKSSLPVRYCVEPQQNIALARNTAIANSTGDYIAFIDDDEFPVQNWLVTLFKACEAYQADGALGPVKPHFDEKPPEWVVKGKFYDRPSYPTGLVIDGKKGRTGNVLLKRELFAQAGAQPFRPQFRTGEDQDFFTRMIDLGHRFVWCHEAMAFEVVPPTRWERRFMLRRALLRGASRIFHENCGAADILKSIVAVPVYVVALPFALLFGYHRYIALLIKVCDHLGKLLALRNINPVQEPYVTQ